MTSLRISKTSPEGKKGWFVKSTWKFIAVIIIMQGCAYYKTTEVIIEGKGIRYSPIGVSGEVAKASIKRTVNFWKTESNTP